MEATVGLATPTHSYSDAGIMEVSTQLPSLSLSERAAL